MCTGKCSQCIAFALYPLVLISITCNVMLFFPGWSIKYAKEGHITDEVKYMGGLLGGGVMVLISALYINMTGERGCCGNRFGMFISIIFAAVGAAGGVYSFIVALLGLHNGPYCHVGQKWERPFENSDSFNMFDSGKWTVCSEPKNVVQFNLGLFLTLLIASCLEVVLCAIQVINGLVGCLCGTCNTKEVLVPAFYIHLTGKQGCCGNRCGHEEILGGGGGGEAWVHLKAATEMFPLLVISLPQMFLSIAFAAVGVVGALYSFAVAVLGLQNGPLCKVILVWTTPFKNNDKSYLTDDTWWGTCTEPKNIVQFNIGLFGTLLGTSALQVVLCAIQMINGLIGCLCGTCRDKGFTALFIHVDRILAVKLLHHEFPAGLITQEQCSICREGADHGGGETRVESPHTYTKGSSTDYAVIVPRKQTSHPTPDLPSARAIVMKVLKNPACLPVIDMTWIRDLTQSMG
ncbi:hypothetical protein L3Q82_022173 [Scortum barcoo]|uniref:Uncharacterized protein n=1 Tax=Scortum barcoo TaxID=214431 RepID=A0ACB8X011_9TELE|nr:hypothetical protein L3Q82_022173 [Scortum barcoo]